MLTRRDRGTLSALQLARQVEAGEITPAAIVDLCAEAIAARESDISAFAALDVEGARTRAKAEATALSQSALRGLPIGVKDIVDSADLPTEYGTPIYKGHQPKWDAALISMIRRAGGLVLGKTVTTELAYLNPAATRNPVNLAHTPGGSSSGSAAAVAAGMLPIATGTQTGGSVIRPAAFCGVAGFKPSFKLIPMVGIKAFAWTLDTAGLFAAGVADVAFAAAAITGRDLRVDRAPPSAPRIALVRTHAWNDASDSMKAAIETAARTATAAGAQFEERTLPSICEDAFHAHSIINDYEGYHSLAFEYDRYRDRLSPILQAMLANAAGITPAQYDDARRVARRARLALAEWMANIDVVLTPSAPGAAPQGFKSTGSPLFNKLWTLMGTPCVNVPGLVDNDGLPLGVQIIGRFGRDHAALAAAHFLEGAIRRHQ